MTDGSLDVRQQAKLIFATLLENENFHNIYQRAVPSNIREKIKKPMENLAKQVEEEMAASEQNWKYI